VVKTLFTHAGLCGLKFIYKMAAMEEIKVQTLADFIES
jgi:hypothetical protein